MPRSPREAHGPSLEGLAGLVIGLLVAYLGAEAGLPGNRHPLHWVLAAVGGGVGYLIGDIIARVKEHRDYSGSFIRRTDERRRPSGFPPRPRRRRR